MERKVFCPLALQFSDRLGGHFARLAHAGGGQVAFRHHFQRDGRAAVFSAQKPDARRAGVCQRRHRPDVLVLEPAGVVLAVALISAVGVLARYYIGKRMIEWTDRVMMRVPLLNKIYGAIKQVNEAFSGNKHSFKTVVLVEFPREGIYSIGFLTSEQRDEVQQKTREKVRVRVHPHDAESHLGLFNSRAGGKSDQARHVRGRRHQIHRQPGFALAGIHAADKSEDRDRGWRIASASNGMPSAIAILHLC